MTVEQITKKQAAEALLFEAAKQIRQLIDSTRDAYGAIDFDDRDGEEMILDLVRDEL